MAAQNNFPKLHNAMWPGLVGKGPDSEPPIDLDTMIDLTAKAEVDGVKFDGIDIFHAGPHTNIDFTDDEAKRWPTRPRAGASPSARSWPPSGRRLAAVGHGLRGRPQEVRRQCPEVLRTRQAPARTGVRKYGVIRIDSAAGPGDWAKDPVGNTKLIAQTWREACDVAKDYGERLAAEGEICWGGMHWKWKWSSTRWNRPTAPASSASRPTWRTRCSTPWATTRPKPHPSRRLRLEGPNAPR
jgi:hypothetical protein